MSVFLSLMALASLSPDPATPPAAQAKPADANKVICKRLDTSGSRAAPRRICMTRAEWDAQEGAARQTATEPSQPSPPPRSY